ncbi:ABC-type branched-subunit amino acid transport system substrate-binding protein [Mucilaginibacter frigoritolerans]|uniref:ABC-type branched-subunit amino acid transport system substrate-binding protein n=1 Tax=Mucilaginibacter frigoritolerans TaxID=652788 RepID=A0A562UF07_9SPHI|nr:ABC transporter substrate-binding protein [Mucilaginibacter frigoritolerans]TWJ04368.1 ABC-type branched-subunit amino acid transport system substrate-binding protein [Mucilaginibacter frigoritolerans]
MISAQNRLLLLSGNRWFLFLTLALLTAACSPKVLPVANQPVKSAPKPVENQPAKPIVVKPVAPKVSTISLLLPFGLDHLAPGANYTSVSLKEADIALGYYRGFKLALDSLTAAGYNYKLQVYDSRDQNAQVHSLAFNPAIKNSDLIVGPVFPDDIKAFTAAYTNGKQPIVSPLSPASPATFKNPELITIIPPLEYHAWSAARYISNKLHPDKIFILRSGFSEENEYIGPFKRAIDSLGKRHIKVVELTVIHGQLGPIINQLNPGGKNVFIVPATDQRFLTTTLRALDSLNKSYPVTVFGHPSWVNFTFLKAELLQRLDTHITSSDHVDYKAENTIAFVRQYRNVYHTEPTNYAIKGFDEGLYLGKLLANDSINGLSKADFTGLHNDFEFQKKPGIGWINTHVNIYKYANFELKKVE